METDEKDVIDLVPDTTEPKKTDELFTPETNSLVETMQSPNFVYGVTGWRLNSNGIIDATGVNIAGSITPSGVITVINGGTGAATLTGILKGNGTSAITTITPLAGTKIYYVADSSGGAVTRKLTFTDGILTAET